MPLPLGSRTRSPSGTIGRRSTTRAATTGPRTCVMWARQHHRSATGALNSAGGVARPLARRRRRRDPRRRRHVGRVGDHAYRPHRGARARGCTRSPRSRGRPRSRRPRPPTRGARNEALGALHGVPVAVRDLCAMAGTATRARRKVLDRLRAGRHGDKSCRACRAQVRSSSRAGRKATEGAWGTHHPDVTPVNPWAPDRWTGSSSGGSRAWPSRQAWRTARSAATGGDRSASRRRATTSRASSRRGASASRHVPALGDLRPRRSMARTVLDVALMYAAIAGSDPLDPTSLADPVSDPVAATRAVARRRARRTRRGVRAREPRRRDVRRNAGGDPQPPGGGAKIVDVTFPDVGPILEPALLACFAEAAVAHAATYPSLQRSAYRTGLRRASARDRPRRPRLRTRRSPCSAASCAAACRRLFAQTDLLVVPVMPIQPLTIAGWAVKSAAARRGAVHGVHDPVRHHRNPT